MTRENKLKKLHTVSFHIYPYVETCDMGTGYEYYNSNGAGNTYYEDSDYPIIVSRSLKPDNIAYLKDRILSNKLTKKDLSTAGARPFLKLINKHPEIADNSALLSAFFSSLLSIPDNHKGKVYCLSHLNCLNFYPTLDEMSADFLKGQYFERWEDMDDDELEYWYDSIFEK